MTDKDKIITVLKAENERLKEEIKQLEDFIKSDGEIDHINHEYTYKLKQTLQEIKAIAKNSCCMTDKDFCSENSCTVCESISDSDVIKQILQKITKAEGEG